MEQRRPADGLVTALAELRALEAERQATMPGSQERMDLEARIDAARREVMRLADGP